MKEVSQKRAQCTSSVSKDAQWPLLWNFFCFIVTHWLLGDLSEILLKLIQHKHNALLVLDQSNTNYSLRIVEVATDTVSINVSDLYLHINSQHTSRLFMNSCPGVSKTHYVWVSKFASCRLILRLAYIQLCAITIWSSLSQNYYDDNNNQT